jgi:tRNA pseudouridine38-40 synthase
MDAIRFKLTVAYDGARYAGWQIQKTGTGVQEKIEKALASLVGRELRLHSSSRTDTGVHAMGMVAHVDLPPDRVRMPVQKLPLAINAFLPEDIRVLAARRVGPDFHARFWAVGKEYRYLVWNDRCLNPLLRHQAWHVPNRLDLQAMREAAAFLVGRHDFRSFAASRKYPIEHTVRTMTRCVLRKQGPLLTIVLRADGFLYKMCRGIAGTLVQVGQGKLAPAALGEIVRCRDRRAAGMTAPAHGLILWKVFYPPDGKAPAHKSTRRPHGKSEE